ncbi:unnamed protein product [Chilo suppressalis]|uniref:Uncharacterized protein n=1 Tax=Chilo suppressalis TaxID=168631 RepID=A0ABN8L9A3_CHISP|nr:unnamed protein product [Chilo suppressalis]
MACRQHIAVVLAICLLAQAFALPANPKPARWRRDDFDNELSDPFDKKSDSVSTSTSSSITVDPFADDDDDDDFSESMQSSPTTGGSNLFSLLRLAGALFPGSSTSNNFLSNMLREILNYNQGYFLLRRQDVDKNTIEIDYVKGLKPPPPPFERQESAQDDGSESDEDSDSGDDDDKAGGGEESVEEDKNGDIDDDDNASNASDDYDEPPEGDGQGGGVLGILAGLSGGEDGQSDLGDLLATISGIVGNLSGDGIDLNALIASGLGLFVGLLSEGEENPGTVIGSYLLTSLDSITGGGAQNNGAFFGNLVSKLVKGTSAVCITF